MMVNLDEAAQPHCPNDNVVMRDVARGYECPECGHLIDESAERDAIVMPPEFDGPAFKGF